MTTIIRPVFLIASLMLGLLAQAQEHVTAFDVEGLKVILKRVPGDIVAARLYVRGGTANYPIEQQGVEQLALEMALYGDSENRSASAISETANSIGLGRSAKSGYDYGYLGVTFPKRYWDTSWELLSDVLIRPQLNAEDFSRIRDELYAKNRRNNEPAEQLIDALSMQNTFTGTDYEKIPYGTEGSLYGLSLDNVKQHFDDIMTKTNCFLVVVGDVSRGELENTVASTLALLPEGEQRQVAPIDTVVGAGANIQHQDLDLNHVQGRTPAPDRYSDAGVANMLGMQLLSDRLGQAAAASGNLDYAPTAVAGMEHRYPTNTLYISTGDPAGELKLIIKTVEETLAEGFSEAELEAKKPFFLTLNYLGQESADAQAHALGDAEAAGDWRKAFGLTAQVLDMSVADVNRVLAAQFEWVNWTYLGNLSQVLTEDFAQIKQPVKPQPDGEKN